ncbi:MAG TPA: hypothetical protein VFB63_33285, partial [Bryobacteraceae bacterium]|nr:hypothetical protein [Bryobacteraceae bacterium]
MRLLDGRVLIAGGYVPNGAAGRAELFDPSKETFEPAGVMVEATANNSAVLLQDGRVLLLGGNLPIPGESQPQLAQLYDPATGKFQSLDWRAPNGVSATVLPSGKVLIAGGWKNGITYLFDPEAGSFRPVGSSHLYPFSRYWHTATLLRNGTVLVTGGDNAGDNSNPTAEAALYDLAAERFIGSGSMAARRQLHSATLLPGGTVLVADGISG